MEALIGYAIAAAVFCFVAGIILRQHGGSLRRAGVTLFALALLPSVTFGVLEELGLRREPTLSGATALVLAGVLVSVVSYAVLRLRTRDAERPRRVALKRPFTHRPDRDLLSYLREQIGRDDE